MTTNDVLTLLSHCVATKCYNFHQSKTKSISHWRMWEGGAGGGDTDAIAVFPVTHAPPLCMPPTTHTPCHACTPPCMPPCHACPHPCGQNSGHTLVKILPCRNFVAGSNNGLTHPPLRLAPLSGKS